MFFKSVLSVALLAQLVSIHFINSCYLAIALNVYIKELEYKTPKCVF